MADEELEQQEQKEDNQEKKEEKKSTVKKIVAILIILDLLVAIILVLLFVFKGCSSSNKGNTSSSSEPTHSERYNISNLDNVFKKIIKTSLDDYGVSDDINRIYAVTYIDNRLSNKTFNLEITASGNDNHFYYLSISNGKYEADNKELIPYLLDLSSYNIDGDIDLMTYEVINETINTSKTDNKYVIVKSNTDNKYLSGYYYENNAYYIYPRKELLNNSDPFLNEGVKATSEDLLFDYYYFVLSK